MKKLYALATLLIANVIVAQTLPSEFYYSADGKTLFTGGKEPTGMYDKTLVRDVYLNFSQADYWALLTANYASETEIAADMIVDGVTYPNVGVRFRGNTSYTMTGTSQKKSFAIDTEFTTDDQNVMGYKNFKFNNAHQDATFMREVLYCRMARKYMPIAKANYIHLYLNNQDWGIYPNIQSLDKTYLEQWFQSNDGARFRATSEETGSGPGGGWGDGTAGLNYIGADTLSYKNYYSLKSSDISYPWQKLVDACQVLSTTTTANWATTTKSKFDVDRALWFLAAENIFTDDDSYVMKGKMDYYAYYEPETGRLTPLEYDGNSTFESAANSWSPFKNVTNVNYPLLNKLLNIPELRQRYLAHYRTILNETFTTANANALIDEINTQISALVASDPKKLYTTAQYTSGVPGLKTIVANRRTFLMNNAEVTQVGPMIASAPYFNSAMTGYTIPTANEVANIQTTVSHASGLNKVNLYYATGLLGNFTVAQMFDDGAHNDGAAADGVYGAQIPGYTANTMVRYYIEAIANNATLSAAYLPVGAEHDIFVYTVQETIAANGVVINEILSSNTADATDEAGDHEDWVELYNNNDFEVDLSGFYLSDDTTDLDKWQFPTGSVIPGGGYMIVWADNEAAEGPLHAAWKISVSGESVTLSDASMNVVDQVIFGAQQVDMGYARVPNGTGDFVIQSSTFNMNNESLATTSFTKSEAFSIYPNPASDPVNIVVNSELVGKKATLYNLMGQKVYETELSTQTQISTGSFSKGIYLVKIGNDSKKLIVK